MQSDTSTGGQGRGQIRSALDAAAPASRIKGDLVVGTMASGASIAIPYVAVKGARPGPCLWVNGQVHGVEINGILAALDFVNGLDPQAMTGTVIVTGTANPLAFDARRKAAPQDDNDLDQTFPGRDSGFIAERMAALFFREAKECADLLISMHTNSPQFDGKPYGVYKQHPNGKVSEHELLLYQAAFDPSVCCHMSIEPGRGELLGNIAGAIDYQLLAIGIPAFMIELGGGQRAEPAFIAQAVKGMRAAARRLGVLPDEPAPALPASVRKVTRRGHVTFDRGGLYRARRVPGEVVKAGEVHGEVMDLYGDVVQTMKLPYDAIVICMRRDPVVHTGDRFVYVGQEWSDYPLDRA